ncbi:hypothetical protein C8R47DRAFT_1127003 [Mycena vitilis]|nr:hypothetical protein C8R47DRAFT_1127003 [Mycena vitilis]
MPSATATATPPKTLHTGADEDVVAKLRLPLLPKEVTTNNLSGRFRLNSELTGKEGCESYDKILEVQGIEDTTRSAVAIGQLTLSHATDSETGEKITVYQEYKVGHKMKGVYEDRILDGTWRPRHDLLCGGPSQAQMRHIENNMLEYKFYSDPPRSGRSWTVTEVWTIEHVVDKLRLSQAWGNQNIPDDLWASQRRFVRHIRLTVPGKDVTECKLIYNYLGPTS